jgi:hypothetical protein
MIYKCKKCGIWALGVCDDCKHEWKKIETTKIVPKLMEEIECRNLPKKPKG